MLAFPKPIKAQGFLSAAPSPKEEMPPPRTCPLHPKIHPKVKPAGSGGLLPKPQALFWGFCIKILHSPAGKHQFLQTQKVQNPSVPQKSAEMGRDHVAAALGELGLGSEPRTNTWIRAGSPQELSKDMAKGTWHSQQAQAASCPAIYLIFVTLLSKELQPELK